MQASSTPLTVIYFYATWCGHCKDFKPIYETLVSQQSNSFPLTTFRSYDVDAPENATIVAQYGVNSLPDIRFVTAAGDTKYGQTSDQQRTLASLTQNIQAAEKEAQSSA
jgi:protein disulfide-isomerase A6